MSTSPTIQKTFADDGEVSEETETTRIGLSAIARETTSTVSELPDWEVYRAACAAVRDTLERTVEEAHA